MVRVTEEAVVLAISLHATIASDATSREATHEATEQRAVTQDAPSRAPPRPAIRLLGGALAVATVGLCLFLVRLSSSRG